MAQQSVNHVKYAFVASNINRAATTIMDPAPRSGAYIAEGEIVVVGPNGLVFNADAASYNTASTCQIVERKDKGIYKSPVIKASNVTRYKVTGYAAPTSKVIYIGYNGVSGSLENEVFVPGTEYMVQVRKLGLLDHYEDNYLTHKLFGYYNATYTTSGEEIIAKELQKNGVANFGDRCGVENFIKIEMVSSSADDDLGATCTFVYGDTRVVASGAHSAVAGSYLRVGTGVTDPVYYVSSVSGTTIYLETPYQGDSATGVTTRILSAPTTSHYGIRLTGTTKTFDSSNNKFWYDVPDFDVTLKNFSNTDVTYSVAASLGSGVWKEVAQLEWEVEDYFGQTSHTDYLMPSRKRYFVENLTYNMIYIEGYDDSVDQISGTSKSKYSIFVAIPTTDTCDQANSAGTSTVASGVAVAIEDWLNAVTSITYNEVVNLV